MLAKVSRNRTTFSVEVVARCRALNASHSRRSSGKELGGEDLAVRRVVAAPGDAADLQVERRLLALLGGRRRGPADPGRRRRPARAG